MMRAIKSDVGYEALAWNGAVHAMHIETFFAYYLSAVLSFYISTSLYFSLDITRTVHL